LGISKTHQWKKAKKCVKAGIEHKEKIFTKISRPKFDHAIAFLEEFFDQQCESLPSIQGTINEGEDVRCAPFENYKAFYSEYEAENQKNGTTKLEQAGYQTFLAACESVKGKLRLMRCKGNFSRCELCENAASILQDPHRLKNPLARDVVKYYRSQHLKQQMAERINLDKRIREARQLDPQTGFPTSFLILPDGMTATKGNTPKFGKGGTLFIL
jgi:hypothetical protein